jgi:nucleotide-binding universal stress UspA family protein
MFAPQDSIVCGVDGGPAAGELARVARHLATALDAPLNVVHVLGASPDALAGGTVSARQTYLRPVVGLRSDTEADALARVNALTDALGDATVGRHVIRFGDPGRRLAKLAEDWSAQFIVVGSRGNAPVTGPLGSVSARLAADAPCPVLIIAPGLERHVQPKAWRGRTMVCGFDGSPQARAAACNAAILASRLGGSLRVVSVGPGVGRDSVDDLVRSAQAAVARWATHRGHPVVPLDVHHELRRGDPAEELERVAATATAPLIAVGSCGLNPRREALLGSVSRRVLDHARRPILVAPATSIARGASL